jgi:DNA-directed RNA polymerase specialized sigma24 family protein
MTGALSAPAPAAIASPPPALFRLFSASFRDVWTWLGALGVPPHEMHDAVLEVFLTAQPAVEALPPRELSRPALFDLAVQVARIRVREAQASNDADCTARGRPISLEALLASSPEAERITFRLYELGGRSCAQIAKLMATSPAVVRTRLESARGRCESRAVATKSPRDLQRLLSPTATTARPLRLALQAALPSPPSSLDEDQVAFELLNTLAAQRDGARISHVTVQRRPG